MRNDRTGWEADAHEPGPPCYNVPMREGETELGMVRRHIEVGDRHIAKQRALIARMRQRDLPTEEAEALLILFEDVQRQHEEHLARLEARGREEPA
jgi:hypothetical protein